MEFTLSSLVNMSPADHRKWCPCAYIRSLSFLSGLVGTFPSTGKVELKWPVSDTVLSQWNPRDAMTSQGSMKEVVVLLLSHVQLFATHGLQHARPPCPSSMPGAYSNSSPLSQWCHPIISSSGIPFSSHLQSFPASGPFPVSQFFASGGQSFGVSASTSVFPMNTQDWVPLGWTGWISLQSKGLLRVFSNTTSINSSLLSFLYSPTLTSIHDYWKNHSFD